MISGRARLVLSFGLIAFLVRMSAAASAAAPLHCAVVTDGSLSDSPLPSLLQEKLASADLRFVEREQVGRALSEQVLSAAFGAGGVAERVRMGELIKADVLIFLRLTSSDSQAAKRDAAQGGAGPTGNADPSSVAELVVCETRGGLRLAVERVALEKDPARDTDALHGIVVPALRRAREPIRHVVAAPPFVSNDLTYRHEAMKAAYARVVEQALLASPGVAVVELDEARAVAREWNFAGRNAELARPLPLYVLGEFRHGDDAAAPASRTVSIQVVVKRGEDVVAEASEVGLAPADVGRVLRGVADRVLRAGGGELNERSDANADAEQLAARALRFYRLGDWEAAIRLIDASLLLKADQPQLHRAAVVAHGELVSRIIQYGGDKQTPEQVRRGVEIYLRGLEHFEAYLRHASNVLMDAADNKLLWDFTGSANSWNMSRYPSKALLAELAEGRRQEREVFLRIGTMRLRDRRGDETWFIFKAKEKLPQQEQRALMLRLIRTWVTDPGTAGPYLDWAWNHAYGVSELATPEGQALLAEVAGSSDAALRAAGARLRQAVQKHRRTPEQRRATRERSLAFDRRRQERLEEERRRVAEAELTDGSPEVIFRPVTFSTTGADGRRQDVRDVTRCIPAGDGIDAFWHGGTIYLMKEKGMLRTTWKTEELNARAAFLAFDGKYLWAPVSRHKQPPLLLVIDPVGERVWEITAADGLPSSMDNPHTNMLSLQMLRVAPLAPGRACVAGYFGRTWLAIVQFDPERGPDAGRSVKVFHEAREVARDEEPDHWKDTNILFQPSYMFGLTESSSSPGGAKPRQRVLVGRGGSTYKVRSHPLLVDPESLEVSVLPHEVRGQDAYPSEGPYDDLTAEGGAIYWGTPGRSAGVSPPSTDVHRVGFPDFLRETVATNASTGRSAVRNDRVIFLDGRIVLASRRWWVGDALGKPFRKLRGDVPDRMDMDRMHRERVRIEDMTDAEREVVVAICHSNHYGLLCLTTGNPTQSVYQVDLAEDGSAGREGAR